MDDWEIELERKLDRADYPEDTTICAHCGNCFKWYETSSDENCGFCDVEKEYTNRKDGSDCDEWELSLDRDDD